MERNVLSYDDGRRVAPSRLNRMTWLGCGLAAGGWACLIAAVGTAQALPSVTDIALMAGLLSSTGALLILLGAVMGGPRRGPAVAALLFQLAALISFGKIFGVH